MTQTTLTSDHKLHTLLICLVRFDDLHNQMLFFKSRNKTPFRRPLSILQYHLLVVRFDDLHNQMLFFKSRNKTPFRRPLSILQYHLLVTASKDVSVE